RGLPDGRGVLEALRARHRARGEDEVEPAPGELEGAAAADAAARAGDEGDSPLVHGARPNAHRVGGSTAAARRAGTPARLLRRRFDGRCALRLSGSRPDRRHGMGARVGMLAVIATLASPASAVDVTSCRTTIPAGAVGELGHDLDCASEAVWPFSAEG